MFRLALDLIDITQLGQDFSARIVDRPLEEVRVHSIDAHVPVVRDGGPHHLRRGPLAGVVLARLPVGVRPDHRIDRRASALGRFDKPLDWHVGIDDVVAINHRRNVVHQALGYPRPNVEAHHRVGLFSRIDPRADLPWRAGPGPSHIGYATHPVGHHGHRPRCIFRSEEWRAACRWSRQV